MDKNLLEVLEEQSSGLDVSNSQNFVTGSDVLKSNYLNLASISENIHISIAKGASLLSYVKCDAQRYQTRKFTYQK
jgi:hypothetical protein